MKLLLINPYFRGPKPDAPQLGLYFIGTYVRDHANCEVEVVDPIPRGLSEKHVLKLAKKADVIGLTCFTDIRFQCFDFAKKVKEENPNCKVILGGVHATVLNEKILRHYPFIDAVVRGEGEETMLEIVKNKPYEAILGITWRMGKKIIRNPDRTLIKNIDNLHMDYSLLPMVYLDKWKDYEVPRELLKLKHLPIIASRGCPFNCIFCASPWYYKRIYRVTSPEELVQRIEYLVSEYNAEYFRFYDALFPSNKDWIWKFCALLKKSKLNVKFRVDVRVGASRDVLRMLKKAGCDVVGMGVESGSDRILKKINKGITREQIDETIKICKELGFWIIGYFMIGMPDETVEDVKKTLELIRFFDLHNYTRFQVYPNTQFYDELKAKGEISDEIFFDRRYDVPIELEEGQDYFAPIRSTSYCKDNFQSANFHQVSLDWPIRYSFYVHDIQNPISAVKKWGLSRGVLRVFKAVIDTPLRGRLHKAISKMIC